MFLFGGKQIGLDIADHTLEAVIAKNGGFFVQTKLKNGLITDGFIKNKKALGAEIKKLFNDLAPRGIATKKVILSVPKKHVFYHIFKFNDRWPKAKAEELILEELEKHSLIPVEKMIYKYRILTRDKNRTVCLIVAVKKMILEEWYNFFREFGFAVEFDLTPQALHRVVKTPTVCLVDLGKELSNISLFFDNKLFYSFSTLIAGDYFTQKISENLNISVKDAEVEKIKNGLQNKNEEIKSILAKELALLTGEIEESLQYAKEDLGLRVKHVVFVGGGSKIKGLKEFFVNNKNFVVLKKNISIKGVMDAREYAEALGLSLKNIRHEQRDFIFTSRDLKNIKL